MLKIKTQTFNQLVKAKNIKLFSASHFNQDKSSQVNHEYEQYLFKYHTCQELVSWTQMMKYFRYVRAFGGHANDGDSLLAKFSFTSTEKMSQFLESLGITDIDNTIQEQHCWRNLKNGDEIFISIGKKPLSIALHIQNTKDLYLVEKEDVERAIKLELILDEFQDKTHINPPEQSHRCFCKEFYPEKFE